MEIFLNFAWVLLAAWMVVLWLRYGPRTGEDRRMQLVALAVLVLILLPVISVTDDLMALQNPAEADCCLRRDQLAASPHFIFPAPAALPQSFAADLVQYSRHIAAPGEIPAPHAYEPALASIQNRPPPSA
jgi:hypothetical protein